MPRCECSSPAVIAPLLRRKRSSGCNSPGSIGVSHHGPPVGPILPSAPRSWERTSFGALQARDLASESGVLKLLGKSSRLSVIAPWLASVSRKRSGAPNSAALRSPVSTNTTKPVLLARPRKTARHDGPCAKRGLMNKCSNRLACRDLSAAGAHCRTRGPSHRQGLQSMLPSTDA